MQPQNSTVLQNISVEFQSAKKSYYITAQKNFTKDEVILTEKPIVCAQFSWNEFYNYKACEYCMRPLETTEENVRRLTSNSNIELPFHACCTTNKSSISKCEKCHIEYCSNECKLDAFTQYHEILCLAEERFNPEHPFNILMETWKNLHLPPETTSINLILKLLATLKKAPNKQDLIKKLYNIQSGFNYEQLPQELLKENFFNNLEELREQISKIFKKYFHVEEFEPLFSSNGFRFLFNFMIRKSQNVSTSALSKWVENISKTELDTLQKNVIDEFIDKLYDEIDKVSGPFLDCEGVALYEFKSILNHSCAPNVEVVFKDNNNVLSLVVLKDIKPNNEIFNSYLDKCDLERSRHTRQKILRENYCFVCECERCSSQFNDPDITSEEEDEDEFEMDT